MTQGETTDKATLLPSPDGSGIPSDAGSEDELIMFLERDQFVADTSRPLPPAPLSHATHVALWALRVFVTVVSLMVIYTFVHQLG